MNTNIEKMLYLGVGILLLALAFTFFFSNYNKYQAYINESLRMADNDRVTKISEENTDSYIFGYEVVHQIMEEKKRIKEEKFTILYSDTLYTSYQCKPEIWVSGKKATDIDISQMDPALHYIVYYEKDPSGKVVKMNYTER